MSQTKSESARINGAKSKGPVTPEGRARSSQNALRHGLRSDAVVLPHEDHSQFDQLRDSYIQDFHPSTQSQLDLVETMAAARWRSNRLLSLETRLFEQEMSRHEETMEKEFTGLDGDGQLAWTLNKMASEGQSLALLIRYEGSLNRTYERALKQLQALQKTQGAPASAGQAAEIPNEPKRVVLPAPNPKQNEPATAESVLPEPPTPNSPHPNAPNPELREPQEAQ
jgi:hypothetical protein